MPHFPRFAFARPSSIAVTLALLWLLAASLFIAGSAMAAVPHQDATPAYAEEQTILQLEKDAPEPGWGSAASGRRHTDRHYILPSGTQPEQQVILQRGGNTWRVVRNGPLSLTVSLVLLAAVLLIALVYALAGPAPVIEGRSGRKIRRFSAWDRLLHWTTAIVFILLALTGLIILFGKQVLIPLMGHDVFSWVAIISKWIHNIAGPLFIVLTILMFFTFLRRNFFQHADWNWFRKGGGLFNHEHIPAGFFNAGEKVWFWAGVVLLGLLMGLTGLMLDFVNLGFTRYQLQWANYLHLAGAGLYTAAALGHIYIGTLGTPGAYRAMRDGDVDVEWAQAHHAYWYDDVMHGSSAAELPPGDWQTSPRT